ncbi:hypothetical protein BT69DRAFT_1279492 [Atractiella rhizophila]|nr:hypothetical protein BT69DRAFT_1279492 [Atractiella rhizophila]
MPPPFPTPFPPRYPSSIHPRPHALILPFPRHHLSITTSAPAFHEIPLPSSILESHSRLS